MITKEQLRKAIPDAKASNIEKYYEPLIAAMDHFHINKPKRIAAFLANLAHESASFNTIEENLNYSAQRLLQVWPRHFRGRNINLYHRQPQKIANVVYANRMGNSNKASGDGWRYRGRGLIQLTGKDNYKMLGDAIDADIVSDPDWILTPEGATISAGWFWKSRGLNDLADVENLREITRKINGGYNGHDDRVRKYRHIRKVLGA